MNSHSEAAKNFNSKLEQCNQLLTSANEHFNQKQFDQAIKDFTKVIMFAPNFEEEADKSGVPAEIRGIYVDAIQSGYAGQMSQKLLSDKSSLRQSVSDDDSWGYWIIGIVGFLAWKFFT